MADFGQGLHRFRTNARYCGMDTEAESLNLIRARPFQIAYCIADNKQIQLMRTAYIWWPDLRVSEDAARITRFDPKVYKEQARPAAEVLAEFDEVLYDPSTEIIFQSGFGYDVYIHRNWRRACGKPDDWSYLTRCIDVNALSKARKKMWVPDISSPEAFLAWQYKTVAYIERGLKTNLELCGKEEGIEHDYSALHEAASDVELMLKVYWKRLFQLDF